MPPRKNAPSDIGEKFAGVAILPDEGALSPEEDGSSSSRPVGRRDKSVTLSQDIVVRDEAKSGSLGSGSSSFAQMRRSGMQASNTAVMDAKFRQSQGSSSKPLSSAVMKQQNSPSRSSANSKDDDEDERGGQASQSLSQTSKPIVRSSKKFGKGNSAAVLFDEEATQKAQDDEDDTSSATMSKTNTGGGHMRISRQQTGSRSIEQFNSAALQPVQPPPVPERKSYVMFQEPEDEEPDDKEASKVGFGDDSNTKVGLSDENGTIDLTDDPGTSRSSDDGSKNPKKAKKGGMKFGSDEIVHLEQEDDDEVLGESDDDDDAKLDYHDKEERRMALKKDCEEAQDGRQLVNDLRVGNAPAERINSNLPPVDSPDEDEGGVRFGADVGGDSATSKPPAGMCKVKSNANKRTKSISHTTSMGRTKSNAATNQSTRSFAPNLFGGKSDDPKLQRTNTAGLGLARQKTGGFDLEKTKSMKDTDDTDKSRKQTIMAGLSALKKGSVWFRSNSARVHEDEDDDFGTWVLKDQHLTEKAQQEQKSYGVDVDRYCKAWATVQKNRVDMGWRSDGRQEADETTTGAANRLSELSHKLLNKGCHLPISVDRDNGQVEQFRPLKHNLPHRRDPLVSALCEEFQYCGFADGSTILWLWRDQRVGSHEMVFHGHCTCVRAVACYETTAASASDGGLVLFRDVESNGDITCEVQLPFFRGARVVHRKRLGTCTGTTKVLWDGKQQESRIPASAQLGAKEDNTGWDSMELFMTCSALCFVQNHENEDVFLVLGTNNGVILHIDAEKGKLMPGHFRYFDILGNAHQKQFVQAPAITTLSRSVYTALESMVVLAGTLNHEILAIDISCNQVLSKSQIGSGVPPVPSFNAPITESVSCLGVGIRAITGHRGSIFAARGTSVYCYMDGLDQEMEPSLMELEGHTDLVTSLAMAPENFEDEIDEDDICDWVVISGSDDHTMRVWRVEQTGEGFWKAGPYTKAGSTADQLILHEELEDNRHPITHVHMWFNEDSKLEIISANQDKLVAVWSLGNTEELVCHRSRIGGAQSTVGRALVLSRDQTVLAFAVDNEVVVWDVAALGEDIPELQDMKPIRNTVTHSEETKREGLLIPRKKKDDSDDEEADSLSGLDKDDMKRRLTAPGGGVKKKQITYNEGAELTRFKHDDIVTCLCMASTGRIFSGSLDRTVRCWRVGRGLVATFEHEEQGQVTAVCTSNRSKDARSLLFVGDIIGAIHVWECNHGSTESKNLLQQLRFHSSSVLSLSTHGDGSMFICGSADNGISIWKKARKGDSNGFNDFVLASHLCEHDGNVTCVYVGSNGRRSITGSDDMNIYMWSMDDPSSPVQTLMGHTSGVTCAVMSSDMQTVYSAERSGLIYVWDLISGTVRRTLGVRGSRAVTALLLLEPPNENTHFLLTLSDDQMLRAWRLAKTERLFRKGHQQAVSSVKIAADGQSAVSGSLDGKLILWDTTHLIHLRVFAGHTGPVLCIDMSADGRLLVSGSADNTVRLWSVELGGTEVEVLGRTRDLNDPRNSEAVGLMMRAQQSEMEADAFAGAFGPEMTDAELMCEDAEKLGHDDQVTSVRLATPMVGPPCILSGGLDQFVYLWIMGEGKPCKMHHHSSPVSCVAVDGEARIGAIGGVDGSVAIWRMHEVIDFETDSEDGYSDSGDDAFDSVGSDSFHFGDTSPDVSARGQTSTFQEQPSWQKGFEVTDTIGEKFGSIGENSEPIDGNVPGALPKGSSQYKATEASSDLEDYAASPNGGSPKNGRERGSTASAIQSRQSSASAFAAGRQSTRSQSKRRSGARTSVLEGAQGNLARASTASSKSKRGNKARASQLDTIPQGGRLSQSVKAVNESSRILNKQSSKVMMDGMDGIGPMANRQSTKEFDSRKSGKGMIARLNSMLSTHEPPNFHESSRVVASRTHGSRVSASGHLHSDEHLEGNKNMIETVKNFSRGNSINLLKFHTAAVQDLQISAEGETLVAASSDSLLSFWSLREDESYGTLVKTIAHHHPLRSCCLISDNRHVLSGDEAQQVFLWDFPCCVVEKVCVGHTGPVSCISATPCGMKAISGGNELILWDLWHGSADAVLSMHSDGVMALQLDNHSRRLVSGGKDNSILVWDLWARKCETKLYGHDGNVCALMLSEDGQKLLSGSWDGCTILWDLKTGAVQQRFESSCEITGGAVLAATMSRDLRVIISGTRLGWMTVWNPETGAARTRPPPHDDQFLSMDLKGACRCLCLSESTEWVLGSSEHEFSIQQWNLKTGELFEKGYYKAHQRTIVSLALAHHDEWMFSGDVGGTIFQWAYDHVESLFEIVRDMEGWSEGFRSFCSDGLECFSINEAGNRMLAASRSRRVALWPIPDIFHDNDLSASNEPFVMWKHHSSRVTCAAMDRDCTTVVTGSYDKNILVHPMRENSTLWFNLNSLMSAANDDALLTMLLRSNPALVLDKVHPLGWSLLHWFSSMGNFDAVRVLLRFCAEHKIAPGFTFDVLNHTVLDIVRLQSNFDMADDFLRQALEWPQHSVEMATWSVCRLLQYNLMSMVQFLDHRLAEPLCQNAEPIPTRAFVRGQDPSEQQGDICVIGIVASTFGGLQEKDYGVLAPHYKGLHRDFIHRTSALVPVQITIWCIYLYRLLARDNGFLQEMSKVDDTRIFSSKVVRAVLLYKWKAFGRNTHKHIIVFFMFQLLSFLAFIIGVVDHEVIHPGEKASQSLYIMAIIPSVMAVISLVREAQVLAGLDRGEFQGSTRLTFVMESVDNCLILVSCVTFIVSGQTNWRYTQAMASLLLWLQTFFYFRGFRGTGALVRVVAEVLHDMRFFFLMMVVMTLAFTFTFFRLDPENYYNRDIDMLWEQGAKVPAPVYAMWQLHQALWLGEIKQELFDHNGLDMLLFVGASIFMTTVLLNLLIAIISDTMFRVKDKTLEAFYKELSALLLKLEVHTRLSWLKKNHGDNGAQKTDAYVVFSTKRSFNDKRDTDGLNSVQRLMGGHDSEASITRAVKRDPKGPFSHSPSSGPGDHGPDSKASLTRNTNVGASLLQADGLHAHKMRQSNANSTNLNAKRRTSCNPQQVAGGGSPSSGSRPSLAPAMGAPVPLGGAASSPSSGRAQGSKLQPTSSRGSVRLSIMNKANVKNALTSSQSTLQRPNGSTSHGTGSKGSTSSRDGAESLSRQPQRPLESPGADDKDPMSFIGRMLEQIQNDVGSMKDDIGALKSDVTVLKNRDRERGAFHPVESDHEDCVA